MQKKMKKDEIRQRWHIRMKGLLSVPSLLALSSTTAIDNQLIENSAAAFPRSSSGRGLRSLSRACILLGGGREAR
ncbi:Protein of unknown function [Gryllus bimaculatus]|nr:Protein of unknown function [Gryllus bimaculatus]